MAGARGKMKRGKNFWLNGKITDSENAKISLYSNSLHYGFGAFEGIRCYNTPKGPAVFRLMDHCKRLIGSWKALGMRPIFLPEKIANATIKLLRKNGDTECYIRPIIFLDGIAFDPNDCVQNYAILTWNWKDFFGKHGKLKMCISALPRYNVSEKLASAKITGSYYSSLFARGNARRDGFHDAIFLDSKGNVSEGTADNIFISKNGVLATPKRNGILDGITRDTVISIAGELGIPVEEKNIKPSDLLCADEVFITGTAAEIESVWEIDGQKIGNEKNPVASKITKKYGEIVRGMDEKFIKYITYVNNRKP